MLWTLLTCVETRHAEPPEAERLLRLLRIDPTALALAKWAVRAEPENAMICRIRCAIKARASPPAALS